MRMIKLAVCIVGAVLAVSHNAYSRSRHAALDCTTDHNCHDAFKDCNYAFQFGNGITGHDTASMYKSCSAYVCNWFMAQKPPWTDANGKACE